MGVTLATNLFSTLLSSNDNPPNSASVNQSSTGILDKVRQIFKNLVGNNEAVGGNETSINSVQDDKWSSFFSTDMNNAIDNISSLFSTNDTSTGFEFMPSYTPPYYPSLSWAVNGTDDGQLITPLGVAIDKDDNVYVSDYVADRIQKFDSKNYVTENISSWGSAGTGDGQLLGPRNLAIDSSNNVYVSDSVNSRIQKFDSNGTFLTKWGSAGTDDGQFAYPLGLAIDGSDNVYVVDDGTNRIQKFDSNGTFLTKWESSGTAPDGTRSKDLAIDSSNNVYVSDPANSSIQKFTNSGFLIDKWDSADAFPGSIKYPTSLAIDSSNNVYVLDDNANRIQKFDSNGTFISDYYPGDEQTNLKLTDMVVDSQGNIITTTDPIGYGWDVFGVGFKLVEFSPQDVTTSSNETMNMDSTMNENVDVQISNQTNSTVTDEIDNIFLGGDSDSANSGAVDKNNNITITINPGATNSASQNPIAPRNTTVSEGSTIIWLNNDSTPHLIVSGTPDQGPSNIFYGDYFDAGESYNVTLDNAGVYNYYDPAWSHIKGQITVVPNNDTDVENNDGGFQDQANIGGGTTK